MPPSLGVWLGVSLSLVPCLSAWLGARALLRSRGLPFLPERLFDYTNATIFVSSLALFAAIVGTGLPMGLAVAVAVFTVPIGLYPLRGPLFQERWRMGRYVAFQARITLAFHGFWLLLAFAPSVVLAVPAGARWPVAGGLAAALMFWSTFYIPVLRALIGARPLRAGDLQARFDAIVARSQAARPAVLEVSPRDGAWWSAVTLPSRSPLVLFGGVLLDTLTAEEATAVFAHELAHIEQARQKLLHRIVGTVIAPAGALACAAAAHLASAAPLPGLLWAFVVVAAYVGLRANSQRWELAADRRAAELCGDPALVARALTRAHALMRLPRRWARGDQQDASHPDLAARVAALLPHAAGPRAAPPVTVPFSEPAGTAVVFEPGACHWLLEHDAGRIVAADWRGACGQFRSFKHDEIQEIVIGPAASAVRLELLTTAGRFAGTVGAGGFAALEQAMAAIDRRIKVEHRNVFRKMRQFLRTALMVAAAVVAFLMTWAFLGCARISGMAPDDGGAAERPVIDVGPPIDAFSFADGFATADIDPRVGEVYAHSELTLYRFDPIAGDFVTVGDFSCLKGGEGVALMLDIAIDGAGNMVGTAAMSEHTVITGRLVSIDKKTAACAVLRTGSYPNSLAFVPVGTVLSDREALVGYVNDGYVLINPDTGMVSGIGNLNAPGAPNPWMSSGDIVSIVGGGTFVTIIPKGSVTADPDGDRIAEVDPATGTIIRVIGATGTSGLYGLGYWGGIAYGFSSSSLLIKIDLSTGAGTSIPISGAPTAGFYGAGTTTVAPIFVD